MCVSLPSTQIGDGADVPACRKPQSDTAPEHAALPYVCGAACRTLRIMLADLAMILCQLLFFINHYRRLMDANCPTLEWVSGHGRKLAMPGRLGAYPCVAPTASRIAFLAIRADSTFLAAFQLPLGELWVPLVTAAILAQLLALLLMPARAYLSYGRRSCMVLVGLLPKAISLVTFLAFPAERPSSYFDTYLPIEGAITVWQQLVYNYPFWPGLAVLAAHCALSTAICLTVPLRLQVLGAPPLFSCTWVVSHTYCCAALAAFVAVQQHSSYSLWLGSVLRRASAAVAGTVAAVATGRFLHWRAEGDSQLPANAAAAETCGTLEGRIRGSEHEGEVCSTGAAVAAAMAAAASENLQLKLAVRRLLSTTSYTTPAPSLGSSAVPSEPESAEGSGSHVSAAGVAQVLCKAAGSPHKARSPPLQQHQHLQSRAEPAVSVKVFGVQATCAMKPSAPAKSLMPDFTVAPDVVAVAPCPPAASVTPHVQYTSPPSRAAAAVLPPPSGALPPAGAFSLKQPTGLSKWTIVEDQEFQPPAAAMGVGVTMNAITHIAARSRRFRRYQSRAPPQRVHMKIPWAEPEHLPGNFLERLNMALSEGLDCMAVGVSVRAGCIELFFDIVPQAAFDSASDFQARRSRCRRVQQQANCGGGAGGADALAAVPRRPARPALESPELRKPGHLDLLGQVGAGPIGGGSEEAHGGVVGEPLDLEDTLEEAVLAGLLGDAEPSSWIEALHLQPPPGAEVLTQACGRVWISRWDHTLRQWVPERAGGMRPSQLPRITQLRPPCVLLRRSSTDPAVAMVAGEARPRQCDAWAHVGGERVTGPGAAGAVVVRVTVSNADGATPPSFSARCSGRYLPVVARRLATPSSSECGMANGELLGMAGCGPVRPAAASPDEFGNLTTFELELSAGLPRNGLVVIECKVGKLLSNWRPVIVTEDALLAEELASLLAPPTPASSDPGVTPAAAAAAAVERGDSSCVVPLASLQSSAADVEHDGASWDELLTDLGLWLDYLGVRGLTSAATGSAGGSLRSSLSNATLDGGNIRRSTAGVEIKRGDQDFGGCRSGQGPVAEGAQAAAVEAAGLAARQPGSLDLGPGLAALYGTERFRNHMAGIAVSLLEFAVDRGWCHTAGTLLSQMDAAGIPWPEVLRRCSDGLTLLHRAVQSARSEMVELVVQLGEQNGTPFDWQAVSLEGIGEQCASSTDGDALTCGVTPLHLAASLPDGGRLAERILSEYQAACELWASAVDSYGMRPVDCARASGHMHLTPKAWNGGGAAAAAAAAAGPQPPKMAAKVAPPSLRPAATRQSPAASPEPGEAAAAASVPRLSPPPGGKLVVGGPPVAQTPLEPSSTVSSSAAMGSSVGDEADNAHITAVCPPPAAAAAPRVVSSAMAAVASAGAAALRQAAWVVAAPFVGDSQAEAEYMEAIGADSVLRSCGYHVYQLCVVLAVAGRMVKELRAHEMVGMLMFCGSHLTAAVMLCANYRAWLRLREPLCGIITSMRTLVKLLAVLGLLPYPHSSTNYMSGGMDVVLEGLVPVYFERLRTPFAVALRAVEGVITGLLYQNQHVELRLAPPGVSAVAYALAWNLGCAAISACLDVSCRRHFAAGRRGGGSARGGLLSSGGVGGGGREGSAVAAGRRPAPGGPALYHGGAGVGVKEGAEMLKGKKVD